MYLHTWSALIGAVVTAALLIIFNRLYVSFFGGKEVRRLRKENRELKRAVAEKDKYIRKSLEELENNFRRRKNTENADE